MDVVYDHCCGIDVHKRSVTAWILTPGPGGHPTTEVRTFGTMTDDLLALGDWLAAQAVTHVAMESTGVSWKPRWNLLEDRFTLLLVNAQHIKAVPGRKTDVKDAEWPAGTGDGAGRWERIPGEGKSLNTAGNETCRQRCQSWLNVQSLPASATRQFTVVAVSNS